MRAFIAIMLAGALTYAYAQWLNYPDPRTPHTKDGKPNLTAPAPRLNGKPDLTGVWQAERTPAKEYERVLGKQFTVLQVDAYDVTKNVVNTGRNVGIRKVKILSEIGFTERALR